MEPKELVLRAWGSRRVHRAVPLPLARRAYAAMIDWRWRRDPSLEAHAARAMHWLLDATPRAADADGLAHAHVLVEELRPEMELRPARIAAQPVRGLEHLAAAHRQGRGVLVSFVHHGYYAGVMPSLGHAGHPVHTASAPQYFDATGHDYWAIRNRAHIRVVAMHGGHVFNSVKSFRHILGLLEAGERVALANDFPGDLRARFLGREVGAVSGLARLAQRSGAPVVCISAHREGHLELHPAIDPAGLEPAELQQAVLTAHEPAVLAWPEAVEGPLTRFHAADAAVGARYGVQAL